MVSILLVEDDPNLGMVIKDNLEQSGYSVILAQDGEEGLSTYQANDFNICLLDVMLPKKDGFTLAEEIRKIDKQTPILFLTAKSMDEDRLKGFSTGGDDYITKPFNMKELIYRIEVFLKRVSQVQGDVGDLYYLGQSTFNYNDFTLHTPVKTYSLTQKEAKVMKHFCENKNQVIKRNDILKAIWGSEDYFLGRSMDVYISKLRKYLKDDGKVKISTVHGVGFRLDSD